MKKIVSIITILMILSVSVFIGNVYAAPLNSVNVEVSKDLIRPGEEVRVNVEFGQALGAYTFDVAYDNSIFEYVSVEGGTPNDTGTKVRVVFYDSTGGTNPRTNMSVTFRAKKDLTTSNPTEFNITAEGLANSDASVNYDDITSPITKNVTVEPEYIDYTLNLESVNGTLVAGEENEMKLSYSSPMGKYYDKARLVAESTGTGDVQLIGTDEQSLDHDIIESGWGEEQGYAIGGKDVSQVLNVRGIFSRAGNYQVTLKLIDRENSDTVIAEKTFDFTVVEQAQITPPTTEGTENGTTENNPEGEITPPVEVEENVVENITENEMPTKLPKTGINIYLPISTILAILTGTVIYYNKKKIMK